MDKNKKNCLCAVAFLQAFGLVLYCSLVALLFWKGNDWFGRMPNYLGPFLFLVLFSTSALVSALLTLGYPVYLFWVKKQRSKGLKLVTYTTSWLIGFIILIIASILYLKP